MQSAFFVFRASIQRCPIELQIQYAQRSPVPERGRALPMKSAKIWIRSPSKSLDRSCSEWIIGNRSALPMIQAMQRGCFGKWVRRWEIGMSCSKTRQHRSTPFAEELAFWWKFSSERLHLRKIESRNFAIWWWSPVTLFHHEWRISSFERCLIKFEQIDVRCGSRIQACTKEVSSTPRNAMSGFRLNKFSEIFRHRSLILSTSGIVSDFRHASR